MDTFFDKALSDGDDGIEWMSKCEHQGKLAVHHMSPKAQRGYSDDVSYEVFSYRDYRSDGPWRFAFWLRYHRDTERSGLTFAEMEEFLEGLSPEEILASKIRAHDKWTDCLPEVAELCEMAGLKQEWGLALLQWEDVIFRSAKILDIDPD